MSTANPSVPGPIHRPAEGTYLRNFLIGSSAAIVLSTVAYYLSAAKELIAPSKAETALVPTTPSKFDKYRDPQPTPDVITHRGEVYTGPVYENPGPGVSNTTRHSAELQSVAVKDVVELIQGLGAGFEGGFHECGVDKNGTPHGAVCAASGGALVFYESENLPDGSHRWKKLPGAKLGFQFAGTPKCMAVSCSLDQKMIDRLLASGFIEENSGAPADQLRRLEEAYATGELSDPQLVRQLVADIVAAMQNDWNNLPRWTRPPWGDDDDRRTMTADAR